MTRASAVAAAGVVAEAVQTLAVPVDITPGGHSEHLSWRGVAGATGARLDGAAVEISPALGGDGRAAGVVAVGREDVTEIIVESPVPAALVRGIVIPQLRRLEGDDEHAISGSGDLTGDLHLVLTPVAGGQQQAPVIAVPPLPGRNALPDQLVGGSLSGSRLSLPDVAGAKFRITVVKGDAPEDFAEQRISHGDVLLYTAPMPVGLHVDGPDGTELFAMAGPVTSPVTVDLRAALTRHLAGAVGGATGNLAAAITVRADVVGRAWVRFATQGGVIERAVEERLSVETTGAPATIALPGPRPGRSATRTVADVTVAHHGMALHPISDPVPSRDADLGGPVVRDTPTVRRLPPEALRGLAVTRVGVIGWPQGETDLRIDVLGVTATVTDLVPPTGRTPPALVWFDLGADAAVDRPVEIALTATRGAFGWVADPEPLVRVAVAVTPHGERVIVGGRTIDLTGDETVAAGSVLAGTDGWQVTTDQFCTVSIANAVMEFAP